MLNKRQGDQCVDVEQIAHGKFARSSSTALLRSRGAGPRAEHGQTCDRIGDNLGLTCTSGARRQDDVPGMDGSVERVADTNAQPAAERRGEGRPIP